MDLSTWTIAHKVGQLVVAGFDGLESNEGLNKLITEHYLGGVILFTRNMDMPEQVNSLNGELQKLALEGSGIPLLIATDQEGGTEVRLKKGLTRVPGNMALGAVGGTEGAYEAAAISGRELRLMGITLNYGPDVDVNNNPINPVIGIRSFGENPHKVGEMGAAAIRGYQEAGISATAKHFPGHGDTSVDSHHDLPIIAHDMERLEQVELVPFVQAIEAGVDMIMTAHVVFPALEPDGVPATLSRKVITGLLREKLNYNGVITTDCLEMKAIYDNYGTAEGAIRAIEAGVDLVLISHTLELQLEAIKGIIAAVESGRITEERLDASVKRVLEMKAKRAVGQVEPWSAEVENRLAAPQSLASMQKLTEKSVTLIRDNEGLLPLKPEQKTLVVRTRVRLFTFDDDMVEPEVTLAAELRSLTDKVQEVVIGSAPTEEEQQAVLKAAEEADQVIVLTANAAASVSQQELVNKLVQTNTALIVASVRSPYDLNFFPAVGTYLACYEDLPVTIRTLARILTGELSAVGKLPVTLA